MLSRRPASRFQPGWIRLFAVMLAVLVLAMVGALSARAGQAEPAPPASQAIPISAPTPAPVPAPSTQTRGPEAVQTSALVNQALDSPIDLDQRNRPLPEVLQAIQEKAYVPFHVTEETWELLPYGRDTPISATVKNTSLRKTLQAITQKLGLTFALREEAIEIRPLPALARTGRRATVQEIAGLDLLATVQLDLLEERLATWKLLEAIDLKLQELDTEAREKNQPEPGFAIESRLDNEQREAPVYVPRNASLLTALEAIVEQTEATWYPWGDSFVVLPKSDWVRRQLETPVNLSYNRVEVEQVLHDLQQAAGVPFMIEPGAVQRIPADFRKVRLFLENATVREALESLGSFTGLGYVANNEGVYIWNDDAASSVSAPATNATGNATNGQVNGLSEPPILMIDLGDGSTMLLYPSDLPEDLRKRIQAQRKAAIHRLRTTLPTPTTQPES